MSRITNYPFYSAYTHLNDFYGIDIPDDVFETMAFVAWQNIGNYNGRIYRQKIYPAPDPEYGYSAPVPCNAKIIESITTDYEDYKKTSSVMNYPGAVSSSTETYIEGNKFDPGDIYLSGKLIKYRQVGDMLYFNEQYPSLNILYKGYYADDDGLPYINRKEMEAIAAYCAFCTLRKKAIGTMDSNTLQLSLMIEADWRKKCTAARVDEYLNLNEFNDILNAKTSWDRKLYNKTFKPIN